MSPNAAFQQSSSLCSSDQFFFLLQNLEFDSLRIRLDGLLADLVIVKLLMDRRLVRRHQVEAALSEKLRTGLLLEHIFVEMGLVSFETMLDLMGERRRLSKGAPSAG